ncbi:hypothetical protein ACJ2A9_07795 [Anaerobacillus sp. MEB173]|uniref:hypothetical protein n=1 Tax=Anaerobacillus sp. MEB173 TaxID=3383345 RepID=UPI003F8F1162
MANTLDQMASMFGMKRKSMWQNMMVGFMDKRNDTGRNVMYSLLAVGIGSAAYGLLRNRTNRMNPQLQPALQPIVNRFTHKEMIPNSAPFDYER